MKQWLRRCLAEPLALDTDIDDPATTEDRRRILKEKPCLRTIYNEWYGQIAARVPPRPGAVLELGSGAGFFPEFLPDVLLSEVFRIPGLSLVADGRRLPFRDGSLRAIVMTEVLHHIPDIPAFLEDSARCVRPGGKMVMLEPWVTPWSKLIYTNLHHEPFLPDAPDWSFPSTGPLSGANGALPWIVFVRDRARFEREYPDWEILSIEPTMPFRYLISGGLSIRAMSPAWSFPMWAQLEKPFRNSCAMFALIVLRRKGGTHLT